MEADEEYNDILFPETERESVESETSNRQQPTWALDFAQIAISQLRRIEQEDPYRDKALSRVKEWVQGEIDSSK